MQTLQKVSLTAVGQQIDALWSPHIVGQVNQTDVRLVKIKGTFCWHHHENEDELFLVLSGELQMQFRDRVEVLEPGDMIIVPRGTEHCPMAETETLVLLIEPAGTLNTGNVENELTKHPLKTLPFQDEMD